MLVAAKNQVTEVAACHIDATLSANTYKLPTLWFVTICATDKQAVLKLLHNSDDVFTGALQQRGF